MLHVSNGKIDAVVIATDGCGTAVITNPVVVQSMGDRIPGICEIEPIETVVKTVGRGNMLDPDTATIDVEAGANKAFAMEFKKVAVTTSSVDSVIRMHKKHRDNLIIINVHTTGMSKENARIAFNIFDIIIACVLRHLREECLRRLDALMAGNKSHVRDHLCRERACR